MVLPVIDPPPARHFSGQPRPPVGGVAIPGALAPIRATPDIFLVVAERLVSQQGGDIRAAARRLVTSAPKHQIDLSLVWATVERNTRGQVQRARQACLAVLGAGRAAMFFLSEPCAKGDPGGEAVALAERTACISVAWQGIAHPAPAGVVIAQALPDPAEVWAIRAFEAAGFVHVGTLTYLRRVGAPADAPAVPRLPGVEVMTWHELAADKGETAADAALVEALDASYIDTLDCPELCGMRETCDVVKSHRSVGRFDPKLWWIVLHEGRPSGCVLLNPCPEQTSVELVYIGMGPALRGKGLGKPLLAWAIGQATQGRGGWEVRCAVDERNGPALRLYDALGWRPCGRRVAMVRPVAMVQDGLSPKKTD